MMQVIEHKVKPGETLIEWKTEQVFGVMLTQVNEIIMDGVGEPMIFVHTYQALTAPQTRELYKALGMALDKAGKLE